MKKENRIKIGKQIKEDGQNKNEEHKKTDEFEIKGWKY